MAPIHVQVMLLSGDSVTVEVDTEGTVAGLKAAAGKAFGNKRLFHLIFGPLVLSPGITVEAAGLSDGDVVNAVIAPTVKIYSTWRAFAMVHSGAVVTWGCGNTGGDSSLIQSQLSDSVESVCATKGAFCAVRADGTAVCWGDAHDGGDCGGLDLSDVASLHATEVAFAAVKTGGAVVTWGDKARGGSPGDDARPRLVARVEHVFATCHAFAALTCEGAVVAWGDSASGGSMKHVQDELSRDVEHIYATGHAFAAVKADGDVTVWGDRGSGGDADQLRRRLRDLEASRT